jgi:hypothetical protein
MHLVPAPTPVCDASYLLSTRGSERAPPAPRAGGRRSGGGGISSEHVHARANLLPCARSISPSSSPLEAAAAVRPLTATEGPQPQLCPRIALPPPDVVALVIASTRPRGHAARTVSCPRSARRSARRRRVGSAHPPSGRTSPVLDAHVAPSNLRDDCVPDLTTPCCSCSALCSSGSPRQRSLADVLRAGWQVLPVMGRSVNTSCDERVKQLSAAEQCQVHLWPLMASSPSLDDAALRGPSGVLRSV